MDELILVEGSRPVAAIVMPPDAPPVIQHAVAELQEHLEHIGGASLPVVESVPQRKPAIVVGTAENAAALLPGVDWSALGEDGCVVERNERCLVLAGHTARGALYAVYEFLESVLGCRWLTPQCGVIPSRPNISVGDISLRHRPVFRYREPYFSFVSDADWAARNRMNGQHFPLDARRGGKWAYAGFVHTFYALMPPEQYFAVHPECFSEVDGVRVSTMGQLCLTNPRVLEIVTENVRRQLRSNPDVRVVSVSQNDWSGNCQCADCRRVDEAEGSPSGSLVQFVNAVAERIQDEFPHVLVDTLAYTYTVEPPRRVRPRKNVVIRLCHMMPCCDGHPLTACGQNRHFVELLRQWCHIAPEVFIWDYFNNFSHYFMPFPNLDAICADLPLYAQTGVTGVFCQGDSSPAKGPGDMAELRGYLMAKLLWRPELDGKAIIDEFLNHYYGAAAEPIRDYLELLHGPVRDGRVHFHLYASLDQPFLQPDCLKKYWALFDEAERRVRGDELLASRVQAARLPVEYIRMKRTLRFAIQSNRYAPSDASAAPRAQRFFAVAAAWGAKGLREGGRPIQTDAKAIDGFHTVTLSRGNLRVVIVPALGGRLISLVDLASNVEWMYPGSTDDSDYPCAGGYEEYSEPRWHSPGWCENFKTEATADEARMEALLTNGLHLRRIYSIETDSDGRQTLLIHSALVNASDQPVQASIRAHPEFHVEEFSVCSVLLRGLDGSFREMVPWSNEKRGDIFLTGDTLPSGAWVLRRGRQNMMISFPSDDVQRCLLGWDVVTGLVRMELFCKSAQLAPGQSAALLQRWTCRKGESVAD